MRDQFQSYFQKLQTEITDIVEMMEGKAKFTSHQYGEHQSEKGELKLLKNGQVFDKGSVHLYQQELEIEDQQAQKIFKTGLRVVFHPKNPNAPILQSHYQYNQKLNSSGQVIKEWIAGEMNLIPSYLINEDASYFHRVCKEVCDKYNPKWYATFKTECDKQYHNKLRQETLGVGGIFFDKITPDKNRNTKQLLDFIKDLGEAFIPSYMPILEKRKAAPSVAQHEKWRAFRRSRFIEFYLLFNNAFITQIKTSRFADIHLAVLPQNASFEVDFKPEEGSRESKLVNVLKAPREWV